MLLIRFRVNSWARLPSLQMIYTAHNPPRPSFNVHFLRWWQIRSSGTFWRSCTTMCWIGWRSMVWVDRGSFPRRQGMIRMWAWTLDRNHDEAVVSKHDWRVLIGNSQQIWIFVCLDLFLQRSSTSHGVGRWRSNGWPKGFKKSKNRSKFYAHYTRVCTVAWAGRSKSQSKALDGIVFFLFSNLSWKIFWVFDCRDL